MAFIWKPACAWYSAADVKRIVEKAIQQTVEECISREIENLDRLQKELEKRESIFD